MDTDISQQLKDVENSLRDFIAVILQEKFGQDWLSKSWITPDKIEKWQEKKIIEEKKFNTSITIEERLIYYADFYDLKTIIEKNWTEFEKVFGNKKKFLVYLDIIWDLRNPEAHRRELFSHQKNLIVGIAWEIRNMIVIYRSKNETGDDYFPRIECIRENPYGRIWTPWILRPENNQIVRVGDVVEFVITASDPKNWIIKYWIGQFREIIWSEENTLTYKFTEKDIWNFEITVVIKSDREHHVYTYYDAWEFISYMVLPKQ